MNEKRAKSFAKSFYDGLVKELDPRAINSRDEVFDFFFKQGKFETNFAGGANSKERTLHENLFHLLYPDLESQITFGTGKGGHKKYLSKKFTVDFLDRKRSIAIEIDGENHKCELQKCKDRIKELFLFLEHGIKTVRFTNQEVEEVIKARILESSIKGEFDWLEN